MKAKNQVIGRLFLGYIIILIICLETGLTDTIYYGFCFKNCYVADF